MSDDGGNNGHAGTDAERKYVSVLTLTYDHATCIVSIDTTGMNLGLAQMMLHEANTQLEEQRRAAMAMNLRNQMAEHSQEQALFERLRKR